MYMDYKNLIATKEAYYQDLENQLKLTQEEQQYAEFISVIYTLFTTVISDKEAKRVTDFSDVGIQLPKDSEQFFEREYKTLLQFDSEELKHGIIFLKLALLSCCYNRPIDRVMSLIGNNHADDDTRIAELPALYDAIMNYDHEIDVLIVEELIHDALGLDSEQTAHLAQVIEKSQKVKKDFIEAQSKISHPKCDSLVEQLIFSGKQIGDASLSYQFSAIQMLCEEKAINGYICTSKEHALLLSLLDNPYLAPILKWEDKKERTKGYDDPKGLFVSIVAPLYRLDKTKLILWIKDEFLPHITDEWEWFGLYYVLNYHKCLSSNKASTFSRTLRTWLGEEIHPGIPNKLSAAVIMLGCRIISKDGTLVPESKHLWDSFRDKNCTKEFGIRAALISYHCIERLISDFHISDFLIKGDIPTLSSLKM